MAFVFVTQNVPNHSTKQNFPPMTLVNNLFAQESDLAPFIGNATKVEIPFEIKQGLLYLNGRNSQKYLHQTQADF